MMQRLVRVGSVETRLDQSAREILRRRDIARHANLPVVRLMPHVVRRRRELERLVRVDAVRRNHILAKIFVLVVAPHDDEVGTKRVDLRARPAQRLHQPLAMRPRRGRALVVAPFGAHGIRPTVDAAKFFRQPRVLQHPLQNPRHRFIAAGQGRVVSYSNRKNLTHRDILRRPSGAAAVAVKDPFLV